MSEEKKSNTYSTTIHTASGQISTGSGDINVATESNISHSAPSQLINTREEFLAALRDFKRELDSGRVIGLPEDAVDAAIVQVAAVEETLNSQNPEPNEMKSRLQWVKETISLITDSTTATTATITATTELVNAAQKLIEIVDRLF